MARIGDDSLIVRAEQRADATWLFTIRYTVYFDQSELGMRFDDSVQVCDDHCARPVPFIACTPSVLRKKRVVVNDDAITQVDNVYATVCLRRRGGPDAVIQSARLPRISAQSLGTRPRGPGTVSSAGRLSGGASRGPS
ncbi:hypothetical protein OG976_09220 [Mycobacterium sp. NBC_00419]|uniref:hypothetical protein n=1 Tax=Mycobacterium sp. NBC_00419 TaxID=2975989 RepID=UPI002E1B24D2